MIDHSNNIFPGHTCSSDLQWETSCNLSPTRRSESLWVKMVLSSRSLISLTASLLIRSEWLRELSALQYFDNLILIYNCAMICNEYCKDASKVVDQDELPVVMAHIRCLPVCRWELICWGSHSCRSTVSATSIASHWTWHCHFGSWITTVSTSCMELNNEIGTL